MLVCFQFAFQLFFFKLTKNQKFDVAIMVVILLNMFTMAIEHYDQTQTFAEAVGYVNTIFIVVFTMECIMKLLGLRLYYFKEPWNVFDFVVVVVSILSNAPICRFVWCGLLWSTLVWPGLLWFGLVCMVCLGFVWSGLSWSGLICRGLVCHGLSWSGLLWSALAWLGL